MHRQILVRVLDRRTDLLHQAQACWDREIVLRAVLIYANAFDILHDEIRSAIIRVPAVEQTRDVGMIESCENLSLAAESSRATRMKGSSRYNLQGDRVLKLLV